MKSVLTQPLAILVPAIILSMFASPCRANEQTRADFFDVVGKSPAEVVAIIPVYSNPEFMDMDVTLGGFVGLPMTSEHRKEFMTCLRASLETDPNHKRFIRGCLLDLLEEDRAFADALVIERARPRTGGNAVTEREIALLWKLGKQEEAARLADGMTSYRDPNAWLSLTRVDLASNHPEEAMRLLAFLEQRPKFPGTLRFELATQHLEIARRSGRTKELFAGSPTPVVRAIWHWALGHPQDALDAALAAGPEPSADDILALSLALGTNSPAGAYAKAALSKPGLSKDARRVLLELFQNPGERFAVWLDMPEGHGETTNLLGLRPSSNELEKIPQASLRVMAIVKAHPGDANLKLFAASPDFSRPDEAKQLLREAAQAVRETPNANAPFSPDPATRALEQLVKTSTPAELDRMLKESPDFAKLSPEAQLCYLMTCDLDQEVVKTMARCHFDQPATGYIGMKLLGYFGRRAYSRQIPPEVIATLLERLPELALGSGVESSLPFTQEIRGALTFLSTQPVSEQAMADAIRHLLTAAGERKPALRQTIINELPEAVRSLPGLDLPPPGKPRPLADVSRPPAVLQGMSIFSPPDITVIGHTGYSQHHMLPYMPGPSRFSQNPAMVAQFAFSPWTQNYRGATCQQGEDPAILAKLRGLFTDDPSRTLVYDLLVAMGALPCPDAKVKNVAERRIADISHPLPVDPAAGMYLFLQKLAKGEPADRAATVLEGYDRYLLPVRQRVFFPVSGSSRFKPADLDILRERLGFPKNSAVNATRAEPSKPISAYDRLQFFKEAGKLDSPEAISIARDVLFNFVDSKWPETSPEENIAIRTLVTTGKFPAFLKDLKTRMEGAGKSELEIQRALYRVHLYRIVHSKGEIFPFAKRIFELDPTDTAAAVDVLAAAAAESDRPLALKAMGTLCRKSPFALARAIAPVKQQVWDGEKPKPGVLSLFPGSEARVVAELMLGCPFKPDDSTAYRTDASVSELLPLYLYFAENDIASLSRILRWANAFSPDNGRDLTEIAEYLVARKRTSEAVTLLADAYFSPPAQPAMGDLQFAPKPAKGDWEPSSLNVYELRRLEILKPLAEAVSHYSATPETAKARVMILLAADPTPTAWDRIIPPFLAASPAGVRTKLKNQLQALIQYNMPEADALNHRLALENQAADKTPPTLVMLQSRICLAAESGESGSIATDWAAADGLLAAAKPDQRTRFISAIAWQMAIIAADPEWKEFLKEARATADFARSWLHESPGKITMKQVAPQRLQDLAEIVLPHRELEDDSESYRIRELFYWVATSESPDLGVLQKFRPWIESGAERRNHLQAPAQLQYLDLLAGDPTAASPQVDAVFTGESWQVSWSLAGCRNFRSGNPFVRKFPFMDGLFDLEILAGTHGDRLTTVHTIPGAAATGRVAVNLPPGSRFISLLARKHDGGIVRWASPQEIGAPVTREAVALPPALERLHSSGPFLLDDAVRLAPAANSTIELAVLPWLVDTPAPQLSGWIQGASVTRLFLSFRTAAGVEIEAKPLQLNTPDPCGIPIWERFSTPSDLIVPPAAETVVLVVKTNRYDATDRFLLSGVYLAKAASAPALPPGLTVRGRAPGMTGFLVMDRKANRFGTASAQGIGVFDLTSAEFTGWIPIGESTERTEVEWLDLAGDRIVFATGNGDLHALSLAHRKVRKIGRIDDFDDFRDRRQMLSLSPDGQFLAWGGIMAGLHVIRIGDAENPAERLIETGQIHSIDFDEESRNLIARDGVNNIFTLPLADWNTATAKVTRAPLRRDTENPSRFFTSGDSRVTDVRHDIMIGTDYNRTLADVRVIQRYVTFPQGILAQDREGVPFFVDHYGRILRIDVDQLNGYEPKSTR